MIIPEEGNITLYHWTKAFPPDKDTVVLDPVIARRKQNYFSRREYQTSNVPRVFFYTQPNRKEKFFQGGTQLYTVTVPVEEIYDLSVDKDKLIEKTKKESNGVLIFDKLFDNILDADYKGAAYKTSYEIVIWFYPIEVKKKEEVQENMTDFYENWNAFMESLDEENDEGGTGATSFEDLFPPRWTGDPSVQNYPMRLEEKGSEFEDLFPPRPKAAPSTQNYPMRLGEIEDGEKFGKKHEKYTQKVIQKLINNNKISVAARIDAIAAESYEDSKMYAYLMAKNADQRMSKGDKDFDYDDVSMPAGDQMDQLGEAASRDEMAERIFKTKKAMKREGYDGIVKRIEVLTQGNKGSWTTAYKLCNQIIHLLGKNPEKLKEIDNFYSQWDEKDHRPWEYGMAEAASFKEIFPTTPVDPAIQHYHTRMEEDCEECELEEGELKEFVNKIREMGVAEGMYKGEKVKLNKPMRTEGSHPNKFKVYVNEGGKTKKITFGRRSRDA